MTNAVITAQQGSSFAGVGFKNRMINGAMEIDQRTAGTTAPYYTIGAAYRTVDRFLFFSNNSSIAGTIQQVVDAPPGFYNSWKATITTGDAGTTVTRGHLEQRIEGYNFHDSGYGTSAAQPFTLSFWVKSNLSGTFGGCWQFYAVGSGLPYSYPYTYSINSANTWEYKTITVPGNTAFSCPTTTGLAMEVFWDLSNGSVLRGPANGTWQQADYRGATGGVNIGATSGATWQITGVQVEEGTVATPFDRRNFGTELAMCQRYFEKSFDIGTAVTNGPNTTSFSTEVGVIVIIANNGAYGGGVIPFTVTKRVQPTMTAYGNSNGHWGYGTGNIAGVGSLTWSGSTFGPSRVGLGQVSMTQQVVNGSYITIVGHWTASAEI